MPAFASSDARLYWAAADSHERSNGRLFRSLTAALPNSLDAADRLDLARTFAARGRRPTAEDRRQGLAPTFRNTARRGARGGSGGEGTIDPIM